MRSDKYAVLWYKKNGSAALRRKFDDNKQIFSFGAGSGMAESNLRKIADGCLRKLHNGEPESQVEKWAKKQVSG